ncbi:hypothetical protein [Dyadobacter frigoris]|uniref:Uncharacterized protein n=1 Tax=Dyadobacter frigoris TaxID=2576211 RepID=A0A4U6CVL9_9BACT|nr:hypothetical protein [Dyadobacter frigoris]TKT87651.1 hypothetical protein FDK13_29130 [Dyadobacter frigoris]
MNKLTILPQGGLGNRMRVLESAIYFCHQFNYKLKVIWINNDDLGCNLEDIFESIGIDYSKPKTLFEYNFYKYFCRYKLLKYLPSLYSTFGLLLYDKVLLDLNIKSFNGDIDIKIVKDKHNLFISTCYPFFQFPNYNNFLLKKSLSEDLSLLKKNLGESYFGIHFRGTDNSKALKNSPLEKYITAIEKILESDSNSIFFLATDEEKVKKKMKLIFGEKIQMFSSSLNRNTKEGIHDAVLELYCLANAHTIICSPFSSFSDTAQLIDKKKRIILIQ